MIFKGVVSKDDVQDYVDGVDGVDHGEGSKSDDEGVGWVMVDDGGTPRLDNQLKISMCENCQQMKKTFSSPIVFHAHFFIKIKKMKPTAAPLSHFSTNCRKASATDST